MKNIIIVNGTMGVGKTSTCNILKNLLPQCVFLDGDWCWDMHPFTVTEETKKMVMDNISYLLNSFIHCSVFKNILFCWVLHQQNILDELISKLHTDGCHLHVFTLDCSPEALTQRLNKDIQAGVRSSDILNRTLPRLSLYKNMDTTHLDVSQISAAQAAQIIFETIPQ